MQQQNQKPSTNTLNNHTNNNLPHGNSIRANSGLIQSQSSRRQSNSTNTTNSNIPGIKYSNASRSTTGSVEYQQPKPLQTIGSKWKLNFKQQQQKRKQANDNVGLVDSIRIKSKRFSSLSSDSTNSSSKRSDVVNLKT